eukprot:CAMPEP_0113662600 /NCGR_PEP_ID=MMETSP0038_2-20120614/667_1 /TAXON_ID=2898 /ORGANISM="Cryptomonas paramecium" /LENGTH=322 /DNA_ID=CAMNT_0000577515 /DNA_START=89 /DNA_END=1054 /DNA_ORIENTATION=- /assembly_acc=CAM_ASM_000170
MNGESRAAASLSTEKHSQASGDSESSVNNETNFLKFLKKDFDDLNLGPIKRPRKKKEVHQESMSRETGQTTAEMPNDDQDSAAAAWRAARAQKSCLHSGKPGSKGPGSSSSEDKGSKWTQLETTWRVSTLPFRLAHANLAVNWKPRTRPSWSKALDQAVSSLRTCSANTPASMSLIRLMTDRAVPSSAVPLDDVTRITQDLGNGLKVRIHYPAALGHYTDAERFFLYVHPPHASSGSNGHRGLVSRLALACSASVVMVDYRRTPESDRAESIEDLVKAYRWLVCQPGVTPAQLLVAADGMGCALAMLTLFQLRDQAAAASAA